MTKISQAGCSLRIGRRRFIIDWSENARSSAESCLCLHGRTAGESKAEERGDEAVRKVEKCPWAADPRTGRWQESEPLVCVEWLPESTSNISLVPQVGGRK